MLLGLVLVCSQSGDLGASFGGYSSFVRQKTAELCPLEPSHQGLKTRQKTRKGCVFFEKNAKNVKITPIEFVSTIKNVL